MFRNVNFAKSTGLALVAALALFSLGAARAHAATTYYACVNNSTGAIVIVSASHACSSSQHKISWTQAGPQGSPGSILGYAAETTSEVSLGRLSVALSTPPVKQTGFYFVTAAAAVALASSDSQAVCYIGLKVSAPSDNIFGVSSVPGAFEQAAITDFLYVTAGNPIELICMSARLDPNTFVMNAALTATLVQHPALVITESGSPEHASAQSRFPGALK